MIRARLASLLLAALAAAFALSACGGGGDDGTSDEPSIAGFCKSYLVVNERTDALGKAADGTLEQRREALGEFAEALQDLAEDSPDEIQSVVQESADWATSAEDAVSDADSIGEFKKAGAAYGKENPQPSDAGQKADTFEFDNCEKNGADGQ